MQVASDIPGTPLALGSTASSILDEDTKHRGVYAIELAAGQEVAFTLDGFSGGIHVRLANPGAESFGGKYTEAFEAGYISSGWRQTYLPTVSGTYYLALTASQNSQPYTLSVAVN